MKKKKKKRREGYSLALKSGRVRTKIQHFWVKKISLSSEIYVWFFFFFRFALSELGFRKYLTISDE